jgi:molecular chaperone HtpG
MNTIEKSIIYRELKKRCVADSQLNAVLTLVNAVEEYAIELSKSIIINMPEYTLHDENHLSNMLYLAGKLIPKDSLESLSTADLMMIILAILLHDIGMSPPREIIMAWKGQLVDQDILKYKDEVAKFTRFRKTFIRELQEIEAFQSSKEFSKAQLIEDQIITEYIRKTHADRARKMIAKDWSGKIKYLNTDLTADLAEICFSHNENCLFLIEMETVKLCAEDTYLCLQFVAVILRLTDIIDFDSKRTPAVLFSHLTIKNPVSLSEWVKHISINAWSFGRESITFSAQCTHPAIESTIRNFCDLIDEELRNCTFILANLHSDICDTAYYKIKLPAYVNRKKIGAVKDIATGNPIYTYHDTKFTLSKRQVVDLLMGTKLYGKPEVALRELIQNSIDTCKLRQCLSAAYDVPYVPNIDVSLKTDGSVDYLIVDDNGVGMNQHIIDNYYTNIGQSYYTSNEFYDLMAESDQTFKPISRFGIGILACFMVCDNLEVETRKMLGPYQTDEALRISVEGYDSLFVITPGERKQPGTKTVLRLRETHPWQRMSKKEFVKCVKKLIPLPPFEINIHTDQITEVCTPESFEDLDLVLEDDYSWDSEENINIVKIDLNDADKGFQGKAEISYIADSKGLIRDNLDLCQKDVVVEGDLYTLSSTISYAINCIHKTTTSLEIDEEGNIEAHDSSREVAKSSSLLSIHGIDVPCSLFPNYTNYGQKAVLELPLPIRFRLDIGSNNDLNLNSARAQIIYDDVWLKFEKQFIETICIKLKAKVDKDEWSKMKKIFLRESKSDVFSEILFSM